MGVMGPEPGEAICQDQLQSQMLGAAPEEDAHEGAAVRRAEPLGHHDPEIPTGPGVGPGGQIPLTAWQARRRRR
eukprot:12278126-Alexandrium_andersonii.AAC.1